MSQLLMNACAGASAHCDIPPSRCFLTEFMNDGPLYSETLDPRHVRANELRMSAGWSFVEQRANFRQKKPADEYPMAPKASRILAFLGVPLGSGGILSEQIETPSNRDSS